jgi:chitin synthase
MFASVFITVKAVQTEINKGAAFKATDLFTNTIFSTLVVSMSSTYVLWFVVSFLFFDPWHMFTSFLQYLLMTPTYINILNVYAFCNTHDITWGTKGDTKPEKLGGVSVGSDGKIKVDLPTEEADLNTQYEKELNEFARAWVPPKKVPSDDDKQEDYYKGFRSIVVLAWMFTNLALCAVILNTGGAQVIINPSEQPDIAKQEEERNQRAKIYLFVTLWAVAGLAGFRFLGAMWFLIVRLVSFATAWEIMIGHALIKHLVPWRLDSQVFAKDVMDRCWVYSGARGSTDGRVGKKVFAVDHLVFLVREDVRLSTMTLNVCIV